MIKIKKEKGKRPYEATSTRYGTVLVVVFAGLISLKTIAPFPRAVVWKVHISAPPAPTMVLEVLTLLENV